MRERRPLVFCHGDLNPRNIFAPKGNLIYIDWEEAGVAYELFDLANYSVFLCLNDAADLYMLTHYFGKEPAAKGLCYFQRLKLMVRAADSLGLLASLEDLPSHMAKGQKEMKDFAYYEDLFARGKADDSAFIFQLGYSHLQEFLKHIDQALRE